PPATYPLSLHDALPISVRDNSLKARAHRPLPRTTPPNRGARSLISKLLRPAPGSFPFVASANRNPFVEARQVWVIYWSARMGNGDRKSTRLNSSHLGIS